MDLGYWVSWELSEFALPVLTGKAGRWGDLSPEERAGFFEDLAGATEDQRKAHQVGLYEAGAVMVPDVDSLHRLLELCPELDLNGYYDGLTLLGVAVEQGCFEAARLLLQKGADPDGCNINYSNGGLDHAHNCDAPPGMFYLLAEHGAEISFDLLLTLFWEESPVLTESFLRFADLPAMAEIARARLEEAREEDDPETIRDLEQFTAFLQRHI